MDSEITPVERVRTAGRAFERMVEFLREPGCRRQRRLDRPAHPGPKTRPQRLAEAGREIFGTDPLFVSEIGPVIGAHVGPGLLGVGGGPASLLR